MVFGIFAIPNKSQLGYQMKYTVLRAIFFLCLCSYFSTAFAQSEIRGKVQDAENGKFIRGASVGLLNSKRGTLTDSTGYFNFYVAKAKKTDTIIISSIGFIPLKITVGQAKLQSIFKLAESFKEMKTITVKAFSNRSSSGSIIESAAYFRAWNYERTGGEIGRIINLPETEYKLDAVKFKVNNSCDSCLFKLHIRDVNAGLPGIDLLSDSIGLLVNSQMVWSNKKMPEFDLSSYNIVLRGKQIFVGVEVQGCVQPTFSPCSLSFVGTDKGGFVFKSNYRAEWQLSAGDYDIYEKVEFSY